MNLRTLLIVLTLMISGAAKADAPRDQTAALSDLSKMFYADKATFRRELLDPFKLDFSLDSLKHVDEYLEAIRRDQETEAEWNRIVLRAGAYVGEVIRRNAQNVQWRWIDYEGARSVEPKMFESFGKSIGTAAVLYDGQKGFVFPLAKVEKHLNNGSEDNVYFFAKVIVAQEE